jgi:putative flippase GtrA
VRLLRLVPDRYQRLARELVAFGLAGVFNTAFGFLLFNLLFNSLGSLWANAVSTAGGTATSFILNRNITYRHRPRRSLRQELPLFVAVNLVGLGIQQGIMALAKVTFNLQSTDRLEFNLARVVSVIIGTIFLLLCYRYLVFRKDRPAAAEDLAIEIGVPLPVSMPAPTNGGAGPINGATPSHGTIPIHATGPANGTIPINGPVPIDGPLPVNSTAMNGVTRHRAGPNGTASGGRHRTVSPDAFHEFTTPLEAGRPVEIELSPELELEELLPIETAPDASARFRP